MVFYLFKSWIMFIWFYVDFFLTSICLVIQHTCLGGLTLIASWMWSCRTTSADRSIYHFRHRINSLHLELNTSYTIFRKYEICLLKLYLNKNILGKLMSSLVSQCSSKVLLDVGVHHRPEMIKLTVPEQIYDEHLDRDGKQRSGGYRSGPKLHQCYFSIIELLIYFINIINNLFFFFFS